MKHFWIALLALGLLCADRASAQDSTRAGTEVVVVLTDGSRHVGVITSESDTEVILQADSGVKLSIPRDRIRSIESLAGRRFQRSDPNTTRLLFAPTARVLPPGSGYVAAYELFFPFVAVGVGNVATLAGGVSLVPGLSHQLVYAAPKITFLNGSDVKLGAGAIIGAALGIKGSGGMFYAVGTVGRSEASLTAAVGFAYLDTEFSSRPVLMIAGDYQLSNSVKLISENYVIPGYGDAILATGGVRFFGDSISADLALMTFPTLLSEGGFPFFPWLGFTYAFGR